MNFKMSDTFILPWVNDSCGNIINGDGTWYAALDDDTEMDYLCEAVNSYDTNQRLIAEQQLYIELLRDTLLDTTFGNMHPVDKLIRINQVLRTAE